MESDSLSGALRGQEDEESLNLDLHHPHQHHQASPLFSLQLHADILSLWLRRTRQAFPTMTMNETCDTSTAKTAFACVSLWPT